MTPELTEQLENFIRFYFFASGVLGAFVGIIIYKLFESARDYFNSPY